MYDVFISYRREGGFEMARLVYEHLRDAGLNPFLDLEELNSGLFDIKLLKSIENSENFVLILPKNSLERCCDENDWLRLEIEHALSKNKNIIPVMMHGFEWPQHLPESIKLLPSFNGVQMSAAYFNAAIEKLMSMLKNVTTGANGRHVRASSAEERTENKYFSITDKKEVKRLKTQQKLLKNFDSAIYNRAISSYDRLRILDVGSNNGAFVMDRLGKSENLEKLIGLEYDKGAVDEANEKFALGNDKLSFYEINVEDEELEEMLENIIEEQSINNFNIINISMLLLHLKSPFRLLKTLRKFLSSDGIVIIKDIDDGLNMAYPDPDGSFARLIEICNQNETAGFRHSGRQIYTLLKRAGYKNISLEKQGLSVVGMDCDERFAMFDTYFSFILEDLRIMKERYPNDKRIAQDLEWYSENYETLEGRFQDEAFYFNLGFMLFTATK